MSNQDTGRDELISNERDASISSQGRENKKPMSTPKKIACGCVVLFVLSLGGCGALIGSIFWFMQQSDAYVVALETAQGNVHVQELLGTPIESGYMIEGEVSINNSEGHADLRVPISGPRGSATVHIVGTRSEGVWTFTEIICIIDDSTERIDLREDTHVEIE